MRMIMQRKIPIGSTFVASIILYGKPQWIPPPWSDGAKDSKQQVWKKSYGTWVPELNGYVKLIGGQGKAKYGFVGINRSTGNIATFHIKYAEDLAKVAPSLGIK